MQKHIIPPWHGLGKKENGDAVPFTQHNLCASRRLVSQPKCPSAAATRSSLMHWAHKGNVKNAFSWPGRKTDVVFPKFPKTSFFTLEKGIEIQHDYTGFSPAPSPPALTHTTHLLHRLRKVINSS